MIGHTSWRFAEVGSTQNVAFELAELGVAHGTVVRTDFQSAGRGRQGKSWSASAGSSLMFSVVLRPTVPLHQLGTISILVADALADVFSRSVDAQVQIKWPNDVLINGMKTSGILLQTRSGPEPVAVLGTGINISADAGTLPHGATCLNHHTAQPVDPDALFRHILSRLNEMWTSFQPELDGSAIATLESRLWQRGELVSIIDSTREIHGRILGLAKNGGLRLFVEGSERAVVAGEIVRGPRPILKPNTN